MPQFLQEYVALSLNQVDRTSNTALPQPRDLYIYICIPQDWEGQSRSYFLAIPSSILSLSFLELLAARHISMTLVLKLDLRTTIGLGSILN